MKIILLMTCIVVASVFAALFIAPKEVTSIMTGEFDSDLKKVWNTVTSLKEYSWRSDISKIEITGENKFTEYTKDGYSTEFTVTEYQYCQKWAFDMENDNIKGNWIGFFSEKDGKTQLVFTEKISAKKFFLRFFMKPYLKKQQIQYMTDLATALKKSQ